MQISTLFGSAKSAFTVFLVAGISVVLSACGGGGVSGQTGLQTGSLAILPGSGSLYGGQSTTLTIAGGNRPYFITSNEPTVLPLGFTVNGNSVTVVPNNPGVVDPNEDPNVVPSRTVIVTVRDNSGAQVNATYNVLQNFMTGYSSSLQSISTCGATGTATIAACAGSESIFSIRPTSAGLLRSQRQIRLSVNYGPFAYIQADNTTLANTFTMTTDSTGNGTARLIPSADAFTQFASLRATDVATGAYLDFEFVILSRPQSALAAIPTDLPTLTGSTSAQCGFGSGTVIISGGQPPYTISASSPFILFTPTTVVRSGGSVAVTYGGGAPPNCASGSLVITDSLGQILTVAAPSQPGTVAPAQPLAVAPTAVCFTAALQTRSVIVTGGNNSKVSISSNPGVASTSGALSGSPATLTITAQTAVPSTATVTINDGASSVTVGVTVAAVCP